MLHVALDFRLVILATNETLCVEDGVFRVGMECILRAVTNTARLQMSQEGEATEGVTHSRSSSEKLTQEGVIR